MAIDFSQILAARQAAQKAQGLPQSQMPGMSNPGAGMTATGPNSGGGAAGRRLADMQQSNMINPNAQLDPSQVELGPGVGGNAPGPGPNDAFGNPQTDVFGRPAQSDGNDGGGFQDPATLANLNQSATAQLGPQPTVSQDAINTMIKYGVLFGMLGQMGQPAGGGQPGYGG